MSSRTLAPGENNRKKVLFFIPSLSGGGEERVFSIILRHLDRTRFEPHLALLEATGEYMGDIPEDVAIHVLNISRVRYAMPNFVRLVWKLRPDTIHATLGHVNVMLMLSKPFLPRGVKLLIRQDIQASAWLREGTQHPRVWSWLYRHFYKRADRILCISQTMLEDMVKHLSIPREKLVSIYLPVDVERVTSLAEKGGNPFPGPGPHLVAVGRLTRQKGFDVLLDAMPAVLQRFPSAQLTILGQGVLQDQLCAQAQRLGISGSVQLPGFQENPWRYIRHATVFVMPSRYEGLPNILLETLVLGTRVIASDCPSAIREMQNCGMDVVLVPPEDPAALAAAIISVCGDPRPCLNVQSSRSAADRFGLRQILEEYSSVL